MSQIDTSPAALRKLADLLDYEYNTEHTVTLLLAIAAEKEAQQPVAWTLQRELDAKQTTCTAHLWFSNPKSSAWTPLYTAPQHHCEQPINMVAQAELDKARQVYLQSDNRLNLEDISAAFESAGVPDESGKQNAPVAPADVPLPEPSRFLVNQISGDLKSNCNHGCFEKREDADSAASYLGTYWSGTEGVFTAEQLHQYAEAYANAKVAAERERMARKPLPQTMLIHLWGDRSDGPSNAELVSFARAVERAHGIEVVQANQKGTV